MVFAADGLRDGESVVVAAFEEHPAAYLEPLRAFDVDPDTMIANDEPLTGAPTIPLRLVAERILLGALREQDAAIVAQAARGRAEFLADASLRFGASLDEELTYDAIASVALPGLDAWCIVDVVEIAGTLRRLAVVHSEAQKDVVARTLAKVWVPKSTDPIGVPAIKRAGKKRLLHDDASALLAAAAQDEHTRSILTELGVGPLLVVEITAHDQLLGALTFVGLAHAVAYTDDEIELAEALAMRCAQALEAARLYATARAAWAEARSAMADAEAARAEAEAARAGAESANASKALFLGRMSHELRTPLNAIGGYAQLLEMGVRGPVTPEQKSDLESIQRSQAHLLGLVEAVLEYAQLQEGRTTYSSTDVDLCEVVAGVHAYVAPQLAEKQLVYSFTDHGGPLLVRADAGKVRQIMINLLANAIKFTPVGGRISVSCDVGEQPDAVAVPGAVRMHGVRVTDSGIGVDADKLDTIFDPFVQAGRLVSTAAIGVGLGLAISRDFARGMEGDLTATSIPQEGSTFTLNLPAA